MLNYNSLNFQISRSLSAEKNSNIDKFSLSKLEQCIDEFLNRNDFSSVVDILSNLENINQLLCMQEKTFFLDYQHLKNLISQDFSEINVFNCSPFFIVQYLFSYYEKNGKFPLCHFNLIETSSLHLQIMAKTMEMLQRHISYSFSYSENSIYNIKKSNPLVYFSISQDQHIFHNVKNIVDNYLSQNGWLLICAGTKTSYHPLHDNFRQLILNKKLVTVFNDLHSSTYQLFNDEPTSSIDFYTESISENTISVSIENLMLNNFRLVALNSSQVQTLQDLSKIPYLTLDKEIFYSVKKDEYIKHVDKGDFECNLFTKESSYLNPPAILKTRQELTLQNKLVFFRTNTLHSQYVFNDFIDEGFFFHPSELSLSPFYIMENFNSNTSRYIFLTMFGLYAINDEYTIKEAPIFILEYSDTKMIEYDSGNNTSDHSRQLFSSLYQILHLPVDENIFDCKIS